MRDALSVELDLAAESLELNRTKKSWLLRLLFAALVIGLLSLVVRSVLQTP